MEKESFESQHTADILNRFFISIKVDKEERPDIDHIYMQVCQMLTGSGGWPLSIFLTPEQEPFYAGTYFPESARYGMPSFQDVLFTLLDLWDGNREKIKKAAAEIMASLHHSGQEKDAKETGQNAVRLTTPGISGDKAAKAAYQAFEKYFDEVHGGVGSAPKFPSPHHIYFLLRYYKATATPEALAMAEKSLRCMYAGGIYDQIGFGFCRYSTDARWLVPHFEKMLYDNALLAIAYTEAYQATQNDLYQKVVHEILQFIDREMTAQEGGFYTAIDADSEGEEGKYYLWSEAEVRRILGEEEGKAFCLAFDITEHGNFEGANIPNLIGKDFAAMYPERGKLLAEREKRVKPYRDDKILTGQNGMMIAAAALAGRVFDNRSYIQKAEKAAGFISRYLISDTGRLLARYRDGEAGLLAYADDYAYYIWGLLELYAATGKQEYLNSATALNGDLLRLFWDEGGGGLFMYGSDGERLIARPKDFYDGAVPSANSVSLHNFIRLAALNGDLPLLEKAGSFPREEMGGPLGDLHFVSGLILREHDTHVTIAGDQDTDGYDEIRGALRHEYLPFVTIVPGNQGENYMALNGKAAAYICHRSACRPPVSDVTEMINLLK